MLKELLWTLQNEPKSGTKYETLHLGKGDFFQCTLLRLAIGLLWSRHVALKEIPREKNGYYQTLWRTTIITFCLLTFVSPLKGCSTSTSDYNLGFAFSLNVFKYFAWLLVERCVCNCCFYFLEMKKMADVSIVAVRKQQWNRNTGKYICGKGFVFASISKYEE